MTTDSVEVPEKDRQERVLDAVISLLSQHGISGVSIRAVAREAGVALGLVNYDYEDKIGLIRAALRRIIAPEFLTTEYLSLRLQLWALAQAALWREAIHLVNEGVATVDDVDTAVSSGPGLRWAVMGPTLPFHLGGDDGGLHAFYQRYADSFNRWWDDLGAPHLDEPTAARLVDGLSSSGDPKGIRKLATQRDEMLTAVVAATHCGRRAAEGDA